jgi:hypothetical protein
VSDCATQPMRFETEAALALEATFDGGRITSDGGLVWLAKMDAERGLCEAISECVPEWRKSKARHSLLCLLRQRIFQIACGYEDQNDSDTLRFGLIKIGGRVKELMTKVRLHLASGHPGQSSWHALSAAFGSVHE